MLDMCGWRLVLWGKNVSATHLLDLGHHEETCQHSVAVMFKQVNADLTLS